MRRLVALFVIALLGAALYGLSGSSSGISVDHGTVSGPTLRSELTTIANNKTLECYINLLIPSDFASGAGGDSMKVAGASAWMNLRVEGIAIDHYVKTKLKYVPNAKALAAAKLSLEGEMTQAAAAKPITCPGTSVQALAEMTKEMRTAEIEAQATSLYLVGKVKTAIPLTKASMESFYAQHTSDYDTLCISVAVVAPSGVSAFSKAQAAGASVATLAKDYSEDPSATKGGAYGCFSPASSSYSGLRADVVGFAKDTFPTRPFSISYNGGTAALYLAWTKRTVTPFSVAAAAVLVDLQKLNATSANNLKNTILYHAAVHVDPAFGLWGLSQSTGLGVFVPTEPAAHDVTGATQLSATGSPTYK
ncbi:MAG TPA: hypothetical protein VND89_11395 [Acidimicrobiales bacterium]|nr:hypothetical protein [Acidimicrobiales bacterium]